MRIRPRACTAQLDNIRTWHTFDEETCISIYSRTRYPVSKLVMQYMLIAVVLVRGRGLAALR